MNEKLAILGGPKAVTIDSSEQWKRPIDEEKKIVCDLIERGEPFRRRLWHIEGV